MGKKREREEAGGGDSSPRKKPSCSPAGGGDSSPRKKHRKNKHKKHKAKPVLLEEEVGVVGGVGSSPGARPLTLRIKLGSTLISSSDTVADDVSSVAESEGVLYGSSVGEGESVRAASSVGLGEEEGLETPGSEVSVGDPQKVGDNDGEEEAWLDALEAGELDERGYLPKKRVQGQLTARQAPLEWRPGNEASYKAMHGSGSGEQELLQLPLASKTEKALTEEEQLKKTEKNRKRRLQAHRRKEKRKAETVRKLLEKQSTKKKDEYKQSKPRPGRSFPHVRYTDSISSGPSLSLPPGMQLPMESQSAAKPPSPPPKCTVEGCPNPKRYSDSMTKLPLCSLECYRKLRATQNTTKTVNSLRTALIM